MSGNPRSIASRPGRRYAAAVMLAILMTIAGCTGAPVQPANRYVLTAPAVNDEPPGDTAHRLRVGRPRLAQFLRNDGVVMQISDVAVHEARHHLWAENLATQLQRNLKRELARDLRDVRVLDEGESVPEAGSLHRLEVDVDGFHGRYDGVAVVAGQWQLRNADGHLLESQRFSIERPLKADGYPALVESLGQAWRTVADRIAPVVESSW